MNVKYFQFIALIFPLLAMTPSILSCKKKSEKDVSSIKSMEDNLRIKLIKPEHLEQRFDELFNVSIVDKSTRTTKELISEVEPEPGQTEVKTSAIFSKNTRISIRLKFLRDSGEKQLKLGVDEYIKKYPIAKDYNTCLNSSWKSDQDELYLVDSLSLTFGPPMKIFSKKGFLDLKDVSYFVNKISYNPYSNDEKYKLHFETGGVLSFIGKGVFKKEMFEWLNKKISPVLNNISKYRNKNCIQWEVEKFLRDEFGFSESKDTKFSTMDTNIKFQFDIRDKVAIIVNDGDERLYLHFSYNTNYNQRHITLDIESTGEDKTGQIDSILLETSEGAKINIRPEPQALKQKFGPLGGETQFPKTLTGSEAQLLNSEIGLLFERALITRIKDSKAFDRLLNTNWAEFERKKKNELVSCKDSKAAEGKLNSIISTELDFRFFPRQQLKIFSIDCDGQFYFQFKVNDDFLDFSETNKDKNWETNLEALPGAMYLMSALVSEIVRDKSPNKGVIKELIDVDHYKKFIENFKVKSQ